MTANTGKINTSNNIEGTEINVLHMDIGVISLVRQGFFLIFLIVLRICENIKKNQIFQLLFIRKRLVIKEEKYPYSYLIFYKCNSIGFLEWVQKRLNGIFLLKLKETERIKLCFFPRFLIEI